MPMHSALSEVLLSLRGPFAKLYFDRILILAGSLCDHIPFHLRFNGLKY